MLTLKKYIYLLLTLFLGLCVAKAAPEYYFKQISLKDGLSESMVKCVLTDHKGLIWIGTNFGLNSFDRERVVNYYHDKKDAYSLPDNKIRFLVEDSLFNLWVSTEKGLAMYDRDKDLFLPVTFQGQAVNVYSYVLVDDGLLLFGKGEFFKYSYFDKEITLLPIRSDKVLRFNFEKACKYTDSIILLASRWNGLCEYNIESGELRRSTFIKDIQIAALWVDASGNIWVSPYGKGLVGYDCNGQQILHLNSTSGLSNNIILDINERDGKLWLATDGGGINIYDKTSGAIDVINHVPGKLSTIPVNSIWCLYNDVDNNMWAGSIRGGLIGMKEVYIQTYRDVFLNSTYGLSYKTVVSMYEDHDSIIWLGTDGGGMNRFDPSTRQFRHHSSTYPSKIVSIIGYNEYELLYSSFGEGLYLLDKRTGFKKEYPIVGKEKYTTMFKTGKSVNLFRFDKSSFYLLADSVYLYDQVKNKLTAVPVEGDSLTVTSLNLVANEASACYLYGETDLFELNSQDHVIRPFLSLDDSVGIISSVRKDDHGDFWIGSTVGLFCYHPDDKTLIAIENDRFRGITSLEFDLSGRLWIGTHNALFAYNTENGKIIMFGESDGVYANEYISNSSLLTSTGDLYMPGFMGLVHISSDIPFTENADPVISLLDVTLNGASVGMEICSEGNSISVPWNYTSLVAKLIIRENDLLRKERFRYYIKGSQEEMIESTNHSIAFHSLSVGSYEVWVSCNKKNGDWSLPVKLLSFEVTPPWWRTNWFLFGCVLFVLACLSFAFRLMVKKQEARMIWAMKERKQQTYEDKIRFLINLNHELRTPLTLIYSPLKRLLDSGEVSNAKHYRQLTEILRQVRRVKDIINMVLDVRKMETGTETLLVASHNLNEWIQQVVDTFIEEFKYKKISLKYQLDDTIGEIAFDASKCEIVLCNLIMNALKFSDENSCITISSRFEGQYVHIAVSDQGIGLTNVDVSRLFERFYQGTHDRKGTGIGLSYARLLVEMHGGRIGAIDNVEKGATFFYELPVNNATTSIAAGSYLNELLTSPVEQIDITADYSIRKYSVLIVEDEPELRSYLKNSLKEYFKQVYIAEDGADALDISLRYLPDIIISDVMMPRMNGFEFCRLLKSNLEVSHIPVILLTARTDPESAVQGYKEGADFYLSKPFDLEFLLAIVRNLLKNREAVKQRYKDNVEVVSPKEDTISNADELFIKKLNALISTHLESPELDVNFVALQMAMSRASLYNKLKALTGISVGDYINKFRMAKVMELLAYKSLSILEVSEKAGFTNQRYFSTVFKQIYGTTPSKYRQEHFS